MRKINTLKKNYEFYNVLKKGKYIVKKHITVYIEKNKKDRNCIGIAINTRTFGAVNRNHIKRLIRENYKNLENSIETGNSIVFLWKKKTPLENAKYENIEKDMKKIFDKAEIIKEK